MTAQNHYHLYIRDRHCPYPVLWMYLNKWQIKEDAICYAESIQTHCPDWDVRISYDNRTIWEKDGYPRPGQEVQDV